MSGQVVPRALEVDRLTLATWNCRRASDGVVAEVLEWCDADVVVLQELPRSALHRSVLHGRSVVWLGGDPRAGLAVVCRDPFEILAALGTGVEAPSVAIGRPDGDGPAWGTVLPVEIGRRDGEGVLRLLAVAADQGAGVPWPAAEVVAAFAGWLGTGRSVVAGDLNHRRRWDRTVADRRERAAVAAAMREVGLVSAYRWADGHADGEPEPHPTFWLYGHEDKPFHLDEVYAPPTWVLSGSVRVGSWAEFVAAKRSDHAPVVVQLHPLADRTAEVIGSVPDRDTRR